MLRSRRRGQSIVEFGIIAILFTLIMFAIADFGLLLNDWLSVSSGARQLARDASVGMYSCQPGSSDPLHCVSSGVTPDLWNEAGQLRIAGVAQDSFASYCCSFGTHGSAIQLSVAYYNQCTPGVGSCPKVDLDFLDERYSSDGQPGRCPYNPAGPPCAHPAGPSGPTSCNIGPNGPNYPRCPGDSVVVTLTAAGAQVITPLVRPFFTNSSTCPANSAHCYVPLSSTVSLRVEGTTL
jgi:hypothetical protein